MKKFFKVSFFEAILLIVVCSQALAETMRTVVASSETTGQKCGNDCYWTVYSDGTLDITGSGRMKDLNPYVVWNAESYVKNPGDRYVTTQPWGEYFKQISKINISDDITYIANRAFFGMNNKEVNFGENSKLQSMGSFAFAGTPADSLIMPKLISQLPDNNWINARQRYCTLAQKSMCGKNALIYEKKGELYFITDQEGNLKQVYEEYQNFADNVKKPAEERDYYKSDDKGNITLYDHTGKILGKYNLNGNLLEKYSYSEDGSISVYDLNGKLIGLLGKRILSVDEATALVSGKNTFKLKYR